MKAIFKEHELAIYASIILLTSLGIFAIMPNKKSVIIHEADFECTMSTTKGIEAVCKQYTAKGFIR